MSTTDHPDASSNESWMQFFRRTKRFADLILFSWGLVEFTTDQLVAREFGLHYSDAKAIAILEELTFDKKLSMLLKFDAITKEDYAVIHHFQQYRNKLFHGRIEESVYFAWPDALKDPVMDNAVEAVNILQTIWFRTRYPEKARNSHNS